MASIFICYSHKDEEWRDRLLEFLQSFNLDQQTVWSDVDLKPGDIWDRKIKEVLPKVKVAVVLVSQPLLNSTYVRNQELPSLLKRCEEEGVKIIPLFVKYADVGNVPFNYINQQGHQQKFYLNQFQSPPNNSPAKPLYTLSESEQDRVLLSVAESLRSLIKQPENIEQNDVPSIVNQSPNKVSNADFLNNSHNPRLKSLQRQKSQLGEQIAHLEKLSDDCNRQFKGEGDLDKRSQLKVKMDNYGQEIDELYQNLAQIEEKISKS